jgi:hypothetical protein
VPIVALFLGTIKSAISKSNQLQVTRNNFTLDVEITVPELTRLVLKDGTAAIVTGLGAGFETKVNFLGKLYASRGAVRDADQADWSCPESPRCTLAHGLCCA